MRSLMSWLWRNAELHALVVVIVVNALAAVLLGRPSFVRELFFVILACGILVGLVVAKLLNSWPRAQLGATAVIALLITGGVGGARLLVAWMIR